MTNTNKPSKATTSSHYNCESGTHQVQSVYNSKNQINQNDDTDELLDDTDEPIDDNHLVEMIGTDFEYTSLDINLPGNNVDTALPNMNQFLTWDKVLTTAKPGDLLEFHRGWYRHWALFEGGSIVIHVRAHNGQDFEKDVPRSSLQNNDGQSSNATHISNDQPKISSASWFQVPPIRSVLDSMPSLTNFLAGSLSHSFSDAPSGANSNNTNNDFGRRGPPTLREAFTGTTALLARDSFALVAGSSLVRINNKELEARAKGLYPPNSPPKTIRNALNLLHQEVPYHILTSNCEHYVTLWKYGVAWSTQPTDTSLKLCAAAASLYNSYGTEGAPTLFPAIRKAYKDFKETQNEDFR
ncbi:unnamed protein product [Gordionus sp. m RMFG-2023]|uniref:uncharacterized protein LOC135927811 n=1 Tax=Gordionus sp. m RMFG-2023 TaxID=3053472 RepID=UPI0030E3DC74